MQVVDVMLEESRNTIYITVPSMFVFRILAYLHSRRSEASLHNIIFTKHVTVQQGQDQEEESD